MVDDRGQLLLIGAILIAVVIVGVVVQLNSLQYTNALGSYSQTQSLDEAASAEATTEQDIEALVRAVRADDPANFEQALRRNLSTYHNYSRNMSAETGTSSVSVSLNESASVNKTELNSSNGLRYRSPETNDKNWTVARDVRSVERFWLNATGANNPNKDFTITITNASASWQLRLNSSAASNDFVVQTRNATAPPSGWISHCDEDEANISIRTGTSQGTGCDFTSLTEDLTPPYEIEYSYGQWGEGSYNITVIGDVEESNFDNPTSQIYHPAVDYRYRSVGTAYNRTILAEAGG